MQLFSILKHFLHGSTFVKIVPIYNT